MNTAKKAKKAWGDLLADVLRGSPRVRSNYCRAGGRGLAENEGAGSNGRERGRLTDVGQEFFQSRYHTGIAHPFKQSDGIDYE